MALSVKVALLTCLFFTGGICWLVNQVARPTEGQIQAPPHRTAPDATTAPTKAPPDVAERSRQLDRQSPVSRSREFAEPASRTVVVPEITLVSGPAGDQRIPPLHNPLLEMRTAAENAQRDLIVAQHHENSVPDAVFAPDAAERTTEIRRPAKPYEVRKGDSLSKICRAEYGAQAAEGQRLLLAENPKVARRDKHTIFEGETLQLPILADATSADESDLGGMEAS